jgi:hypothetical protein
LKQNQPNPSDAAIENSMERIMEREAGLWMDHCKAVIVTIAYQGNGIGRIEPDVEKQVRFSGVGSLDGWAGNLQDRRFASYLTSYYDDIIACILDADSIQIFGPGEAKLQLKKRLRDAELDGRIVSIETVEKMTERQIEGKIWQHFLSVLGRVEAQNSPM